MLTISDLMEVMPACSASIVKVNVEKWNLSPEAVDALVRVFYAIDGRNLTIDEVLLVWKKHNLHTWTTQDADDVALHLERVYHDLRLSQGTARTFKVEVI